MAGPGVGPEPTRVLVGRGNGGDVRARRRRKTRYTWLPADGTLATLDLGGGNTLEQQLLAFSGSFTIDPSEGVSDGFVSNVIADFPRSNEDSANESMADSIGSEYFLKRIVGKVFVEATATGINQDQLIAPQDTPAFLLTFGFFVAPYAYELTGPTVGLPDIARPIGTDATATLRPAPAYNPQLVGTAREPWIWRRSWLLNPFGNLWPRGGSAAVPFGHAVQLNANETGGSASFPPNNAYFPGVLDGPHIDAKTARRIRKHERLWLSFAGCQYPEGSSLDPDHFVAATMKFVCDVRCLGALRKARNRSSFE